MSENVEIRTFTAPFSTSDLFLYLIPGATSLVLILFAEMRVELALGGHKAAAGVHLPALHALRQLAEQHTQIDKFVFAALFFAVLIIVAYVLGHVISSISSFAIDRGLVFRGHGYPYRYILGFRLDGEHETPSEAFYRGIFVWANVALLSLFIWRAWDTGVWVPIVGCVPLVVGSATKLYYDSFRDKSLPKKWGTAPESVRRILGPFAKPYDIVSEMFAHMTGSRKPFAPEMLDRFRAKFAETFQADCEACQTDTYWMTYCAVMTRAPQSYKLVISWLYLYEFARNLSTVFYVAAIYCAAVMVFQQARIGGAHDFWVLRCIPLIYLLVSGVMLVRYYYLYACYYTKFLFRAFIALPDGSPSATVRSA